MADVFDVLASDHMQVRRLLVELESGPTRSSGATTGQLALRKKMADQLVMRQSRHEALEEMYFWPAINPRARGGGRRARRQRHRAGTGRQDGPG